MGFSTTRRRRSVNRGRRLNRRVGTLGKLTGLLLAGAVALGVLAFPAVSSAATFTVNSTNDPGVGTCDATECTLREAINAANAAGGTDTIAFAITGVPSIKPLSELPPITDPAIVDGTTQPGYSGSPIVELDGTLAPAGSTGLIVGPGGGGSTIRGLVINRFSPTSNIQGGGIHLRSGANGNVIEGNYIGTDVTGTIPLGNVSGIFAAFSNGNTIGGTTAAARNVIADNKGPNGAGIWAGRSNLIQGNYIGTDVTGTAALGNGQGVILASRDNLLGGTSAAARNVISGNIQLGVQICGACIGDPLGATGNLVQGNYIGTDASGSSAVPNVDTFGGAVLVRSPNNTIGGTTPGAGNVISGNLRAGVVFGWTFGPPSATDNLVQGNLIGTAADGTSPLWNTGFGVHAGLGGPSLRNAIGGTAAGAGNTIAYNGSAGVFVEPTSAQNPILGNSIFANGSLGIDLSPPGVTPNDPGDTDPGANNLQNFPVLTSASSSGGSTTVQGTLNSTPNTTFRVEFFSSPSCDPSGFGEGKTFLGSQSVTTDGSGNASFTATVPTGTSPGDVVTSAATDPDNNTSEFSNCTATPIGPGPPATLTLAPSSDTNTAGEQHCVTATVKDSSGNPVSGVTVEFSASGANSAASSDPTDSNGEATFCYTGTTAGNDTISAFADVDGDGTDDGASEPDGTASKTYVAGPPDTLSLLPSSDTNTAGDQHCVTATVKDSFGNPVSVVTVEFSASGANSASGSDPTDSNGEATFCYTGTTAGNDTISAFADVDGDGTDDGASEPDDTASKKYVAAAPATLDLTPATATNEVDSQHCVTATVEDAFGNATLSITVRFSVTGSVSTSGSETTDASGEAEFCYGGPELPGADAIGAFADTDGDTTQDAGEPSDAAAKAWVLPVSTPPCKVTNGVRITANNGDKATFGGNAQSNAAGNVKGQEEYQDHGPTQPQNVKSIQILALTCNQQGTQATIFGRATIDGSGSHLFRIDVQDLGEPGVGTDTYRILLDTGYDSGQHTLEGGNVQIHKP